MSTASVVPVSGVVSGNKNMSAKTTHTVTSMIHRIESLLVMLLNCS